MLITSLLITKYLTGVVSGFATFVIIFNGFLYLFHGGDRHQEAKAKLNMISAFIGIFICATASAIVSVMTKTSHLDLEHATLPFSLGKTLFIMAVLFGVFFILYVWTERHLWIEKEKKTNLNLKKKVKNSASSVYSLQNIEEFYKKSPTKDELDELFVHLATHHRDVLQNRHLLSLEQQYRIEESFVIDVLNLFHSYQKSEPSIQASYQSTVQMALEQLQQELHTVQQQVQHHQTNELEKSILRISNRYE